VMLRHIMPEATPDDAANLVTLRRVIEAARKVDESYAKVSTLIATPTSRCLIADCAALAAALDGEP
jgi:hypothetical protein